MFWVPGHFPDYAVMPGVLIVEALAQTGAVALLSLDENRGRIAFFGGIDGVRFKRQVRPGDTLRLECTITKRRGPVGFGMAKAFVDDQLVVAGELMFAIQ
jgi:3-hydroxyacyl-[acyl-carrier-protein] dehydratase